MPLPVIDHCYRVTFDYNRFDGVKPANVIHVIDPAPTHTEEEIGAAVEAAIQSHWAQALPSGQRLLSLTVLPLDGSSASHVHPVADTGGEQSGDTIPGMAVVISMRTLQRGPRGRGRVYLGPVGESAQTNGIISPSIASTMGGAWESFRTHLISQSPSLVLVVASYKHGDTHEVTACTADALGGIQRRRQRQLR